MAHPARTYLGLLSLNGIGVLLLPPPPLGGMLVHHKAIAQNFIMFLKQFASTHLYCYIGWREARWYKSFLPRNTTQWSTQVSNKNLSRWIQHTNCRAIRSSAFLPGKMCFLTHSTQENSFDQFAINYMNEKLHQVCVGFTFTIEQVMAPLLNRNLLYKLKCYQLTWLLFEGMKTV